MREAVWCCKQQRAVRGKESGSKALLIVPRSGQLLSVQLEAREPKQKLEGLQRNQGGSLHCPSWRLCQLPACARHGTRNKGIVCSVGLPWRKLPPAPPPAQQQQLRQPHTKWLATNRATSAPPCPSKTANSAPLVLPSGRSRRAACASSCSSKQMRQGEPSGRR